MDDARNREPNLNGVDMNQEKQKVNYRPLESDSIKINYCAVVYALNHPRLHERFIRTSTVQSYDEETGVFETLNSIYTPEIEIKPSTTKPTICHKHG